MCWRKIEIQGFISCHKEDRNRDMGFYKGDRKQLLVNNLPSDVPYSLSSVNFVTWAGTLNGGHNTAENVNHSSMEILKTDKKD